MKGKKIKQINNLTIYYTKMYQFAVWTPEGKCLEDRLTLDQAIEFCKSTKDFTAKEQEKRRALQVSSGSEKKSAFLDSKEIYCGYYRIETDPANAVFSFDVVGKELVMDYPYFVSANNSTYLFRENMMDTEFVLQDNKNVHSVVYYSTNKQKCIDWVREKQAGLLAFHLRMAGVLEESIIKGLDDIEQKEERKE